MNATGNQEIRMKATNAGEEELVNDLIAVIWPLLDQGVSRDEVMCSVHNVLDSWEPSQE
jgi:hypothetical protein